MLVARSNIIAAPFANTSNSSPIQPPEVKNHPDKLNNKKEQEENDETIYLQPVVKKYKSHK